MPLLADFAAVHLLDRLLSDEDPGAADPHGRPQAAGAFRRVAIAHGAEYARWAHLVPEGEVQVMSPASLARQAIASGEALVVPHIGAALAREMARTHRYGDLEPLVRDRCGSGSGRGSWCGTSSCRRPAPTARRERCPDRDRAGGAGEPGHRQRLPVPKQAAIASAIQLSMLPTSHRAWRVESLQVPAQRRSTRWR